MEKVCIFSLFFILVGCATATRSVGDWQAPSTWTDLIYRNGYYTPVYQPSIINIIEGT